jgi:hypothetical protein
VVSTTAEIRSVKQQHHSVNNVNLEFVYLYNITEAIYI